MAGVRLDGVPNEGSLELSTLGCVACTHAHLEYKRREHAS